MMRVFIELLPLWSVLGMTICAKLAGSSDDGQ